jgi:signal transduction histidine kinase/CheY-like chemotaxis protein/HPt (histidine-containing phosphotransfer) domain-containing protein
MSNNNTDNTFKLLLPFHLLLSVDCKIESFGISIENLFPSLKIGDDFCSNFSVEGPEIPSQNYELKKLVNKPILLSYNNYDHIHFTGIIEYIEQEDKYIFVGNPYLNARDIVIEKTLKEIDLKKMNSVKGLLDIFKNKQITNLEFKELLVKVSQHKKINKELEKALKETKKASDSKEAFLANMSHEIRTPLNGIIGMIRKLRKDNPTITQQNYIDNALRACKHLLSLINNILDFSKIKAGELNLEKVDFNITDEIDDVKKILSSQASDKQLTFTIITDPKLEKALIGDPSRIRQILINITGNAIKFTEQGFVEIKCVSLQKTAITEKFEISVNDSGIGMSEKYLEKIFSKFQQEDGSSSRRHAGTGLGMTITKELVDLMNGEIIVTSEKGKGTQVKVILELPIGNPENIEVIDTNINTSLLENKSILIVEDNEMNRYVAINALEPYKVKITEAENGERAIEKLKNQHFDVILMDLQMPIMGGERATEIIRNELKINTPIIALTANALIKELEKCLAIGMNNYIIKPFEEIQLIKTVIKEITLHQKNQDDKKLYSLSKLEEMANGNEKFVPDMLKLFLNLIPNSLQTINDSYKTNDLDVLRKTAHKIKPSINNLGITSIKEDILVLEKWDETNFTRTELETTLQKVNEVIDSVIDSISTKEKLSI